MCVLLIFSYRCLYKFGDPVEATMSAAISVDTSDCRLGFPLVAKMSQCGQSFLKSTFNC